MHPHGRMLPPAGRLLLMVLLAALAACQHAAPKPRTAEQRAVLAQGDVERITGVARQLQLQGDWQALRWLEYGSRLQPSNHLTTRLEVDLARIHATGRVDPASDATAKARASARRPQPRKALRWYHAAAYHGSPYAFSGLRDLHRERDQPLLELRWQLRMAVYHRRLYQLPRVRGADQQAGSAAVDADAAARMRAMIAPIEHAAARGDSEALVDLGALYQGGIAGLDQDPQRALRCYEQAAAQGNVFGQYFAGLLLGRGAKGLEKDPDAAAGWFAKAHAQKFYMAAPSYWEEAIKPPFFQFSQ